MVHVEPSAGVTTAYSWYVRRKRVWPVSPAWVNCQAATPIGVAPVPDAAPQSASSPDTHTASYSGSESGSGAMR
ncbi:hypothetical protein ACIO3O_21395 [Streptomyces sp. NPDC087440]|uniref:hypothetical protein n=1 Tax=Streptomyces sp. NPDC087440 TaxID=3365790 RepID=UPI00382F79E5